MHLSVRPSVIGGIITDSRSFSLFYIQVLVIYWLSSGIYTLLQNSILAVMDSRSEVIKATRKQQLLQQRR